MTTLNLKPQHETSVIGQLLELKSSLNYHSKSIAPFYHEMEKWEMKEYKAVGESYQAKYNELYAYLINNEAIFNNMLSSYNLSVAVFINKYLLHD